MTILRETSIPGVPRRQGKVRDVFDLGDRLVLVASDRISAFDWILPGGVPDKGCILTGISRYWFDLLGEPNHMISASLADMGPEFASRPEVFGGRSVLVKKTQVVPIECVVRGYLAGSGWKEYQVSQTVCGIPLPSGLRHAERLPESIFTPATKATSGHDENITEARMIETVGEATTAELKRRSIGIYRRAAERAAACGLILADTKFEFGFTPEAELILIDEALTPDSSRYWPADGYEPGTNPASFDKQFVRDWLESIHFDKSSEPPQMPLEVAAKTRAKYVEAFERITGGSFAEYLAANR